MNTEIYIGDYSTMVWIPKDATPKEKKEIIKKVWFKRSQSPKDDTKS